MITTSLHHLAFRCRERGYTLDEARACIVSQDGDQITVDADHPAYPRNPKPGSSQAKVTSGPGPGPGTEMKALLARIGITASPTCSCNARARRMDEEEARTPGWCEAHIDEIVGWLREEATKRKIPFLDVAGRVLVRRAIANAKRATLLK
jgi:hypothetical protein